MRRQLLSALLVVALLTGSLSPALNGMGQPTPQEIDDRPGVEVVATAEAQSAGGQIARQLSAFLTVPNVIGGWFDTGGVNTTATDANQTKIDIYQSAQNAQANFEVYNSSLNNYLEDSLPISMMEGKNALIRAYNNQSSEAAATTAAKEAQDDYYSTKEWNLVQRWNNQIANAKYLRAKARNETGVSDSYVSVPKEDNQDGSTCWDGGPTQCVNSVKIVSWGETEISPTKQDHYHREDGHRQGQPHEQRR